MREYRIEKAIENLEAQQIQNSSELYKLEEDKTLKSKFRQLEIEIIQEKPKSEYVVTFYPDSLTWKLENNKGKVNIYHARKAQYFVKALKVARNNLNLGLCKIYVA